MANRRPLLQSLSGLDAFFAQLGGPHATAWRTWREENDWGLFEHPHPEARCLFILFRRPVGGESPEEKLFRAIFGRDFTALTVDARGCVLELNVDQATEAGDKQLDAETLRQWLDTQAPGEFWRRLSAYRWRPSTLLFSLAGDPEEGSHHAQDLWLDAIWSRACRADAILTEARNAGLPLPGKREGLFDALVSAERARLRAVRQALECHLDRETLRAMREAKALESFRTYNWLVSAAARARRAEALRAFPALMSFLCEADGIGPVVDDGAPLLPALARRLDVPKWVVRALARSPAQSFGRLGEQSLVFAARCLALIAPEQSPKDHAQWRALLRLTEDLIALAGHGVAVHAGIEAVMAACGAFLRKAARRGWGPTVARWRRGYQYTQSLRDLHELTEAAERAIEDEEARRAFYGALIGLGVEGIRALGEDFHRVLQRRMLEATPDTEAFFWPALCRDREIDGLRVTALTTPHALRAEGIALEHCVGTYALRCLLDPVHIVSLRDAKDRPLSSAELIIEQGGGGPFVRIVQHRARRNRRPAPRLRRVLARYLEALPAHADFAGIERELNARRYARREIYRVFEQSTEGCADGVLREVLPESLRVILRA